MLWSDKDDDEESSNVLQLVHRKDGIASLEFITLVASNSDIAKVSVCININYSLCACVDI